ncbi:MAG: hypothetical protein OXF29_03570 [Hyphomicrobiales bacterium]|nr:hypothetical protein [Hyphomicrobiales bacterium]
MNENDALGDESPLPESDKKEIIKEGDVEGRLFHSALARFWTWYNQQGFWLQLVVGSGVVVTGVFIQASISHFTIKFWDCVFC